MGIKNTISTAAFDTSDSNIDSTNASVVAARKNLCSIALGVDNTAGSSSYSSIAIGSANISTG
jgi:hypothetical protein